MYIREKCKIYYLYYKEILVIYFGDDNTVYRRDVLNEVSHRCVEKLSVPVITCAFVRFITSTNACVLLLLSANNTIFEHDTSLHAKGRKQTVCFYFQKC